MAWDTYWHPEAETELNKVPDRERAAMNRCVDKLAALGPLLPFPHSSAVKDADRLRELRPRRGNSPWRTFYRQVGEAFVLAAVGPEAKVEPRLFTRAVRAAERRLMEVEDG